MKQVFNKAWLVHHKDKAIKYGVLSALILTALFVFLFQTGSKDQIQIEKGQSHTSVTEEAQAEGASQEDPSSSLEEGKEGQDPEADPAYIIVDIEGAVAKPTVTTLASGSRVEDAIQAAGGLTAKADTRTINRAAVLQDGEKIYIPAKGEEVPEITNQTGSPGGAAYGSGSLSTNTSDSTVRGKININRATSEELQRLTGVGPATADKIILYRKTYGAFKHIEDIKNVDGIGEKTYENIKDDITI